MSGVKSYRSRHCFVPGCRTGYVSDTNRRKERGESCPSLFQAPKDPMILQQWQQALPRLDRKLNSNDVVCSLHFLEEDILNFYETKLTDGSISRIERGRPKLKNGSVPSILPSNPLYESRSKKQRKCLPLPNADIGITTTEFESSEYNFENITDVDFETDKTLMFENLKISLDIIHTPNKQWSGTFIPGKNEVVFAEWDDIYNPEKKIVICQDMSYKVLRGKTEIKLEDRSTIITTFDELEDIMKSISKI